MFLHHGKGRGAVSNPVGRFERLAVQHDADADEAPADAVPTEYFRDGARAVVTRKFPDSTITKSPRS